MSNEKNKSFLSKEKQFQVYADLVQLYPDNEAYLKPYAELLLADNKVATATEVLRHLYHLLLKKGDASKADALVNQFPIIGRVRISKHHNKDFQAMLPAAMRNRLWLKLHQKRLHEGQHLIHHGETGDTCYLICKGELTEFSKTENSKPIMLNMAGPGDIICEDKLFKPGSHKYDIIANKSSTIIKLPRKKMVPILARDQALKNALQRQADLHQTVNFISFSPVLQTIPLDMRRHLAKKSFTQRYAAGSIIHNSGEKLKYVELVVRDEACYQLQGGDMIKDLKTLKPGELIGAVRNSACPADMVTHHGVSMIHIPYAVFLNVVEAYPPLAMSLTAYVDEQRVLLMQKLNELQTQAF